MALDVGTVRIGVAATDPERRLAFPVETVARGHGERGLEAAVTRIVDVATERGVVAVFVGLPRTLTGSEGVSAQHAHAVAVAVRQRLAIPVRLLDERFSTATASASLREAGRNSRTQRGVIDQAAAVVILDLALDGSRNGILGTLTRGVDKGSDDGPIRG
jgi:putative Holliday junction resolvase